MTITRSPITGAYHISTLHKGHLVQRSYLGYTKAEAIQEFKHEILSL